MVTSKVFSAAISTTALILLMVASVVYAAPQPPPLPQDQELLTKVYQAGLQGDQSAIPYIINALRRPNSIPPTVALQNHIDPFSQIDPLYTHTALRAAVQLHATVALPEIEALIRSKDPDASALARVTKSRILAEASTRDIPNPQARAAAQVRQFYRYLGLTYSQINSDLDDHNKPPVDDNGRPTTYAAEAQPTIPLGVYAMREIADMLYNGNHRNYVSLPEVARLKMNKDMPSMLKRRFARVTREEKISAILEDLAHRNPGLQWDPQQNYIMQLAADEGPFAADVAIKKLQQMEAHPEQYPSNGYYNLIELVGDTGSKIEAARLEKMHDARRQVTRQYQNAAENILANRKTIIVAGC